MKDYYAYLEIPETATAEQIEAVYHRKRTRLQFAELDEEVRRAQLQQLDEAYAVLQDKVRPTKAEPAKELEPIQDDVESKAIAPQGANLSLAPLQPQQTRPQRRCPYCQALNPAQATMCLNCGEQISRPCPACGQMIALDEKICPRCDTIIPEYDQRRFVEAETIQKRVEDERRASKVRVDALEAIHRINARLGVIFWLIVMVLCVGLTVATSLLYTYFSQVYR